MRPVQPAPDSSRRAARRGASGSHPGGTGTVPGASLRSASPGTVGREATNGSTASGGTVGCGAAGARAPSGGTPCGGRAFGHPGRSTVGSARAVLPGHVRLAVRGLAHLLVISSPSINCY